ncbi:chondroitinase-B domain-containing protein [Marinoscillum sp. MHG1-6]|uniref:chondroitinase-B domain-containing protein n=1 Tax=Marinoscillum sp. MHG1-6 TaxID=2959627 RepID=UPI002157C3A9|nr:chondroitinase-B domain-containing protein [Marinoscillum sp. MHG1-6]
MLKKNRIGIALIMLIVSHLSGYAQTKTVVSNSTDFSNAIKNSGSGDTVVMLDGVYNGVYLSVYSSGEEGNPLVIMAENIGGVEFTGTSGFVLKAVSHVVIQGFKFSGGTATAIKLEGCNNIRITRNIFDLQETTSLKWVLIGGKWDAPDLISHHNRIDHNTFQNKSEAGNYITVDGSGNGQQSQYDLIDHNLFRDNTPRIPNGKESIRVGVSTLSRSSGFTTLEFNYFEHCHGDPEIISVKSCDNIVRHNTLVDNQGTITLRQGSRSRVEGNYIFGSEDACNLDGNCPGGIRVYGEDHVVVNNYLQGLKGDRWDAPITLTYGDAKRGGTSLAAHYRPDNIIIAYNTLVDNDYGIQIGFDNGGKYNLPPKDVIMAFNLVTGSTNELIKYYNDPEGMVWVDNVFYPTGSAVLTQDGTKTFGSDEISVADPQLTFDATTSLWKSTESTQQYLKDDELIGSMIKDVHGDLRGSMTTVGADEFSMESIRFAPLAVDDVGPFSYHLEYEESTVSFDQSSLILPVMGGAKSVTVEANGDWSITNTADWITLDNATGTGSSTIEVTVAENQTSANRIATIVLVGTYRVSYLTIEQSVNEYTLSSLGNKGLFVFPVPSDGKIQIKSQQLNEIRTYEINDLSGQLINKGNLNTDVLDISHLKRGVYILSVVGGNGQKETVKFSVL